MQAKLSNSLLPKLAPKEKPYEVNDTDIKGFLLRVQPTGKITYYCSYRTKDKKRNRVLLGSHPIITPAQARDQAKQVLAKVIQGEDPGAKRRTPQAETLSDFVENTYAPWVKTHRKDHEATLARLASCFSELNTVKLGDLSNSTVEQWRTKRIRSGIKPATINRDIAALRSALTKAVEWAIIDQHPFQSVRPMKVDSSNVVRYLTPEEEKRLRQALDDRQKRARNERHSANKWRVERGVPELPDLDNLEYTDHIKPMVLIAINTGIRQGELFQMKWLDIHTDTKNPSLTVAGDISKSGKTRHLPLNSEAQKVFKKWREQSTTKIFVFENAEGNPFDNIKKAWGNLLTSAEINSFRWHDLRHHFASRLVMAGVDLNTVRELLGHSDMKVTLRYAHLAPEHKAAAVEKLMDQQAS